MGGPKALIQVKKKDMEDPFGGTLRTLENITGTGTSTSTGDLAPEAQAARSAAAATAAPANEAAVALGFTSEADRIKKVTNIINSFARVRQKKAPLALQSATPNIATPTA